MVEQRTVRRLAAILAADVVGYSRLMEADEEGTRARLQALQSELIAPRIAADRGRIVKTTGDGILVEFPSAVDAVRNALAVQQAMDRNNADVPEDRRIAFRVGINLGDVIVEGDDIHGEGVNVAARLEGLCGPGEVYVSGTVHDHVEGKLSAHFDDLGEQRVKNISKPVRVYRARDGVRAEVGRSGAALPLLPDKPSIAVLPFDNMSGDPEQEFFADGMTEDILTELSRFRELFVISRTSAFAYKGKPANIQDVARELGVQYVVEGSVRKAGSRVRVTVQLIDAVSDRHVWAERYDRDLEDIFAIQDEISGAIVATLPGRIEAASRERVERKPTDNMVAYECVLAGKILHHRSNIAANADALRMLDRAIQLDPRYAHAHAWRACTLGQRWVNGWSDDPDAVWNQAVTALETALALDENDSDVHRILAAVNLTHRDFDKAMYHQERALGLNPNDDLVVVQQGELLTWLGQPEEGIEWIRKAMRLNPYHPERFWNHLGRACYAARRYGEAIDAFNRISAPDHTHQAFLAACHAQIGDDAAASNRAGIVLERAPGFSIEDHLATQHYKLESDREHYRDGLRKAGLPA